MQRFLLEARSCKLYYDNFWVIRAMGLQSLGSSLCYCATILSAIVGIVCTFGALAYHYLVVALEIALVATLSDIIAVKLIAFKR